jgi:hypothetical protein
MNNRYIYCNVDGHLQNVVNNLVLDDDELYNLNIELALSNGIQ